MGIRGGEPAPPGPCPWRVYYHGKGYKKQSFCSPTAGPSPGKAYIIRKSIPDRKVLSCAHGRLVLYDYNAKSLSICNSATLDDTQILPDLNHLWIHKIDSCVLLPPPGGGGGRSNNWHDFTVLIFLEEFPSIMLCRVGERKWIEISYGKYLEPLLPESLQESGRPLLFRRAVGFGGKIYAQLGADWIGGFLYSMMSIEITVEQEENGAAEFGLVLCRLEPPVDMSSGCFPSYVNVYMLESCGELFFLYFSSGTQVFEVYRMNSDTMAWERMRSIKDTPLFFIGESYCLSCPAPSGSGGHIYFTRRKDNHLYCYNMEDDSVLMSSPRPNLPTPCLSPPIWMMPQLVPLSIKQENERSNEDCNFNNQRRRSSLISKLELSEFKDVCITQWCDLPYDLLECVSKNIIAIDYMTFRAVNKICRSICPSINWRIALAEKSYCFSSPLLMFPERHESVYKFVDPNIKCNSNNYFLMKTPDSFGSHIIRYSDEGWVLLSKSGSCVNLYNPFKRDIITFNYNQVVREESLFFVGKPPGPVEPIHVAFYNATHVIVSSWMRPDEDWAWDELMSKNNFDAAIQISPVFFNNAFYYLDKTGKLGKLEIDLQVGNMRWEVLEKPQGPTNMKFFYHNFLVECGGELISVFLGRAGKWVSVYKLNNDDQVWEKVSNLGGYDLYLNPTSSSAVPSSSGGNRIYFPLLRGSDIVYFSMETGKWHFSGSQHESSTHLYGTRWYPNSCWIKPCW